MRRSFGVITVFLALVCSCQFPGCGKGPLAVNPDSARPGNLVRLHQERGDFQSYDSLRVVVGGLPAYVTRVINNTDLDVLVPMQLPGTVEVKLQEGRTVTATARLAIRQTDCERVVMKMEGGHVSLLRVDPCTDAISRDVAAGNERLSFDLVDPNGRLIHTTSILHPLKTPGEAFSPSGAGATIERRPPPSPAVFWVRVPRDPQAKTLRVYEAEARLDLTNPRDRDNRVLLDSLTVKSQ